MASGYRESVEYSRMHDLWMKEFTRESSARMYRSPSIGSEDSRPRKASSTRSRLSLLPSTDTVRLALSK